MKEQRDPLVSTSCRILLSIKRLMASSVDSKDVGADKRCAHAMRVPDRCRGIGRVTDEQDRVGCCDILESTSILWLSGESCSPADELVLVRDAGKKFANVFEL